MSQLKAVFTFAIALSIGLVGSAHADWRTETGVFRIGLVENADGLSSLARYEPFRAALSAAIGMPTEVLLLRDAPSLIDAQTSGRIEYAVLSSLGYAAAQEMCACLVPLAAPKAASGATGVRSVLLVDARQVDDVDDLGGKTLGIGPKGSLTGDLAPRVDFQLDGAPLDEAGLELVEHVSFEVAGSDFLSGAVAGFFAWEYALSDDNQTSGSGLAWRLAQTPDVKTRILWRSPHVPFGPHTVRDNVPAEIRQALRDLLIGLDEKAPDAYDTVSPALAGGFIEVTDEDYTFARRIVRTLADGQ